MDPSLFTAALAESLQIINCKPVDNSFNIPLLLFFIPFSKADHDENI